MENGMGDNIVEPDEFIEENIANSNPAYLMYLYNAGELHLTLS